MRMARLNSHSEFELEDCEDILALCELISDVIELHGYKPPTPSHASIEDLRSCSTDQFARIRQNVLSWSKLIKLEFLQEEGSEFEAEPAPDLKESEKEIHFARYFLKSEKYRCNDEIWKLVGDGDVIEFYDLNGIQQYRSFNFFKYCSYSIVDIITREWHTLWIRPKAILERMHQNVQKALELKGGIHFADVPTHVLREEKLAQQLYGIEPNAALITFKYLTAVFDESNRPVGFISIASGELIARGKEAEKIQFV